MDDPMVRSRLGRIKERDLWGLSIPSGGPSFLLLKIPCFVFLRSCESSASQGAAHSASSGSSTSSAPTVDWKSL